MLKELFLKILRFFILLRDYFKDSRYAKHFPIIKIPISKNVLKTIKRQLFGTKVKYPLKKLKSHLYNFAIKLALRVGSIDSLQFYRLKVYKTMLRKLKTM